MRNSRDQQIENIKKLGEEWPSSVIARKRVGDFTGGMLSPRTMANLDSLGLGPDGIIKIGNSVGYLKNPYVEWLIRRVR